MWETFISLNYSIKHINIIVVMYSQWLVCCQFVEYRCDTIFFSIIMVILFISYIYIYFKSVITESPLNHAIFVYLNNCTFYWANSDNWVIKAHSQRWRAKMISIWFFIYLFAPFSYRPMFNYKTNANVAVVTLILSARRSPINGPLIRI